MTMPEISSEETADVGNSRRYATSGTTTRYHHIYRPSIPLQPSPPPRPPGMKFVLSAPKKQAGNVSAQVKYPGHTPLLKMAPTALYSARPCPQLRGHSNDNGPWGQQQKQEQKKQCRRYHIQQDRFLSSSLSPYQKSNDKIPPIPAPHSHHVYYSDRYDLSAAVLPLHSGHRFLSVSLLPSRKEKEKGEEKGENALAVSSPIHIDGGDAKTRSFCDLDDDAIILNVLQYYAHGTNT